MKSFKNIEHIRKLVQLSFDEDSPSGDVTTRSVECGSKQAIGKVIAKQDVVWCGELLIPIILQECGEEYRLQSVVEDGAQIKDREEIALFSGSLSMILRVERVLLNFVQHLSGISTHVKMLTKDFPELTLLDTRKTLPAYRELEKYAVRVGGGKNHRFSLSDQILIKDNHIIGSEKTAEQLVRLAHKNKPKRVKVEVEVTTYDELVKVLSVKPDIVLLDNMDNDLVRKCVGYAQDNAPEVQIEISGNINRKRLKELKDLKSCAFSMGALTYGASHVDLSLDILF